MTISITYKISEIPDALYHQYKVIAGGDVLSAVARSFEFLMRAISVLPEGSVTVSVRYHFTPAKKPGDIQSRLAIYLVIQSRHDTIARHISLLVERGPLKSFVDLDRTELTEVRWEKYQAVCEISRRTEKVTPLHQNDLNHRIPPYYLTFSSFEPRNRNDYLDFDRILARIDSRVILDITIEPADIKSEHLHHTRYLSVLQSINRTWDPDEDEESEVISFFSEDAIQRPPSGKTVTPLRYKDPLADNILRSQQRFHETLVQHHVLFRISVLSESAEVAQLIGSVVGESAFENGSYRMEILKKGEKAFEEIIASVKNMQIPQSHSIRSFFDKEDNYQLYESLARLRHLAPVEELSGLFRIPVASQSSPCCIRQNTDQPLEDPHNLIVVGFDQGNPDIPRGSPTSDLCKNASIFGVPGTGKTTLMHKLLFELHRRTIPFLVIETVKTEYRILKTFKDHIDANARSLSRELEIYTAGDETVSPLRFNPCELLPGISRDEHIDNILYTSKAAMPLEGSMPALLGEGLELMYEQYPNSARPPQLNDLVAATQKVLEGKRYSPEVSSNLKAALEARLGRLTRGNIGKIFDCRHSNPQIEHLMNVPAIIELDRLENEQACLLTLFILTAIREYLRTVQKSNKNPRYVIIIEEAHRIVGGTGQAKASPDNTDPKAFTVEFICNMLAEVRALEISIFFVDQSASGVAPQVIKNTATKIAFRQVADDDRREIGAAMLFGQVEIEDIARLNPGEALFYREGFYKPRRITTIDLTKQFDYSTPVLNDKILPSIQDDPWYKKAAIKRIFHSFNQVKDIMDDYDKMRIFCIQELVALREKHAQVIAQSKTYDVSEKFKTLRSEAINLRKRLTEAYRLFLKKAFRKPLFLEESDRLMIPELKEIREDLVDRYNANIEPDTQESLNRIKSFIRQLDS